ncbi:MAG: polysaccharide deacetylase [Candidatus Bathyarchaeota archaeon]|nr:MAG: polysaccharide deacetylase [Candidatus Bathyarchaeota archaeon]
MDFWPTGYRCCVNLSFDYDSNSDEVRNVPFDIVARSRGRFAPKVAVPRILDLLDRLEIKATFFTPGWTVDMFTGSVENIVSRGHEIGAHGYLHEKLTELSFEAEEDVFHKSLTAMAKIGVKPIGFRAPYWLVGERTIKLLMRLGFRYDSSFMDNDMPYKLIRRQKYTGLIELPIEWMLDDWPLFETNKKSPEAVYNIWKPEFEGIYELGRYFGLTCHPQTIGRVSRLNMLEKLLSEMKEKGDVWFATCKETADWTRKKLSSSIRKET